MGISTCGDYRRFGHLVNRTFSSPDSSNERLSFALVMGNGYWHDGIVLRRCLLLSSA